MIDHRRGARTPRGLGALAIVVVLIGGCSDDDRVGEAEAGIAEVFADRLDVADVTVRCPDDAALESGSDLSCEVSVGRSDPQAIAFAIGEEGSVSPTVAVIPTTAVEGYLASELATSAGGEVEVDCGDAPLVVHDVGGTFSCDAVRTSDGVGFDVAVEVRSLDGSVTYTVATTTPTTVATTTTLAPPPP